jgi:HEXXH motif-containing protein
MTADRLDLRIAARTARRLAAVRRVLGRIRQGRALQGGAGAIAALAPALSRLPREDRIRLLCGPDLRGFVGEAEIWIEVLRLATPPRGRRPAGRAGAAAGPASDRGTERLFDRVSRTEHLTTLVPSGRPERDFPARARRFAIRRLRAALDDLAALLVGLRLAAPGGPVLTARLRAREDPEQARPRDRIDLGALPGPAGPLTLIASRALPGAKPLRATVRGASLFVRPPGSGGVVFAAAGTRVGSAGLPAAPATRPTGGPGRRTPPCLVLARRELVPGTPIILAPVLISRPRQLRVGREVPGLGRRLSRALRIVRLAWPEAHREILLWTHVVAPVRETGLVSYSLASRPGISFLNVARKPAVVLADDLLHETAHHRLHAIQEIRRLLVRGPETEEVQAFDSPWRRARRPLHGLLHGAYTFLDRAILLRRILATARARPRSLLPLLRPRDPAWVRGELRRERAMIAAAMAALGRASRAGLLTARGRALLREMRTRAERERLGSGRADGRAEGRRTSRAPRRAR